MLVYTSLDIVCDTSTQVDIAGALFRDHTKSSHTAMEEPASRSEQTAPGLYPPPTGFCGCLRCLWHFRTVEQQNKEHLRYTQVYGPEDTTEKLVVEIRKHLSFLQEKLNSHGDSIVKRWTKKSSRTRREEMLRKHLPGIPTWNSIEAGKSHNAKLLPYLSIELLRDDPLKLLALLHYRTKYAPEQWIAFDSHQIQGSWQKGGIDTEYQDKGVILYGKDYGKLVPWNIEQAHQWHIAGFPRGKLIIEAQLTLMKFLSAIVEDLLVGVNENGSLKKWTDLVTNGFNTAATDKSWSPYTKQAFSAPLCDFDRLQDIALARINESADKLWLLQTDPAFFQRHARETAQPRIVKATEVEQIAMELWTIPHGEITSWTHVLEELESVQEQYKIHRDCIKLGDPLPQQFDYALGSLDLILGMLVHRYRISLMQLLPIMEAFKGYYIVNKVAPHRTVCKFDPKKTGTEEQMLQKDPLFWCLIQVCKQDEQIAVDVSVLFGFLDDWLEGTICGKKVAKEDQARMDQILLGYISNLAALCELRDAVRLFRPMSNVIDNFEDAQMQGIKRTFWRRPGEAYEQFLHSSPEDVLTLVELLKIAREKRFPTGKRDAAWLEQAEEVYQNIKAYWAQAKQMQAKQLAKSEELFPEEIMKELESLSFDQAEDHLRALAEERKRILSPKSTKVVTPIVVSSLPFGESDTVEPSTSHSLPTQIKTKPKTRPTTSKQVTEEEEEGLASVEQEIVQPSFTIALRPASLRVFQRLFPLTAEEYSGKPVDWFVFVQAMIDVGFSTSQTSGGSHVAFWKAGVGRILFQKPHPEKTIDLHKLRGWGKRLDRRFGWTRENFVSAK